MSVWKKKKEKKKMVAKIKHCYSNYDYCEEKARKCTCKKVCGDYVTVLPSKDFFFYFFFFDYLLNAVSLPLTTNIKMQHIYIAFLITLSKAWTGIVTGGVN